jgi:hypothetical protein
MAGVDQVVTVAKQQRFGRVVAVGEQRRQRRRQVRLVQPGLKVPEVAAVQAVRVPIQTEGQEEQQPIGGKGPQESSFLPGPPGPKLPVLSYM